MDGVPDVEIEESDIFKQKVCVTPKHLQRYSVILFSSLSQPIGISTSSGDQFVLDPEGGAVNFTCASMLSITFHNLLKKEAESVCRDVLGLFQDNFVNPSSGALSYDYVRNHIDQKQLFNVLKFQRMVKNAGNPFYQYLGKDLCRWIVLHSSSKKPNFGFTRGKEYSDLLKFSVSQIMGEEVAMSDLYQLVRGEKTFDLLLSSNFTVLKKFLVKFNAEFLWFQDEASKKTLISTNTL